MENHNLCHVFNQLSTAVGIEDIGACCPMSGELSSTASAFPSAGNEHGKTHFGHYSSTQFGDLEHRSVAFSTELTGTQKPEIVAAETVTTGAENPEKVYHSCFPVSTKMHREASVTVQGAESHAGVSTANSKLLQFHQSPSFSHRVKRLSSSGNSLLNPYATVFVPASVASNPDSTCVPDSYDQSAINQTTFDTATNDPFLIADSDPYLSPSAEPSATLDLHVYEIGQTWDVSPFIGPGGPQGPIPIRRDYAVTLVKKDRFLSRLGFRGCRMIMIMVQGRMLLPQTRWPLPTHTPFSTLNGPAPLSQ